MPINISLRNFDEDDTDRAAFLRKLDSAVHIDLTDWELQFLDSNMLADTFTRKQREQIDRLRSKYESRI